ncbi:MAG TPA: aminotransferase class V-fold PLP-dependent enzyme [Patescibacteria group bacterium]
MKKTFFTVGPAQLYPTVTQHFTAGFKANIGSISHRSKQFQDIYETLSHGFKKLLQIPEDYHIFIVGSGTEAMERAIQNCVEQYSFHFVNGSFSKRFFATAQELGKTPEKVEVPFGEGFEFEKIKVPKKTELLCFTHNETSTGVAIPANEIAKIAKKYPEMLVAVDVVSSAPYVDLDYRLLDVVFFSVQKLFGLPAGLGIMIVSPRAIQKAEKLIAKGLSVGSYHSFPSLLKYATKFQTPETPPVMEIYVLGKVIEDLLTVGITQIRKETEAKAKLLYDAIEKSQILSAFVKYPVFRSQTVIVADISKIKGDLKKTLSEKGLLVGSGYGVYKETHIRIANFPTHSIAEIKKLIKNFS